MSYVEMYPVNLQVRLVSKAVEIVHSGGVIALPTDSGYAIACTLGNKTGMDLIHQARKLDEKHNFSLLRHSFAQLGELVLVDNSQFRMIKAPTPGAYTFILPGMKEVPGMTLNKKKHTTGVCIPGHVITQAIVEALDEPLLCLTLILSGEKLPPTNGYEIDEAIGKLVDLVIVGLVGGDKATTVIDFIEDSGVTARRGAGDTLFFEQFDLSSRKCPLLALGKHPQLRTRHIQGGS